jgi:hypothetical protein
MVLKPSAAPLSASISPGALKPACAARFGRDRPDVLGRCDHPDVAVSLHRQGRDQQRIANARLSAGDPRLGGNDPLIISPTPISTRRSASRFGLLRQQRAARRRAADRRQPIADRSRDSRGFGPRQRSHDDATDMGTVIEKARSSGAGERTIAAGGAAFRNAASALCRPTVLLPSDHPPPR